MNPFKYGRVVSDPYFVGRKDEINEIELNLKSSNNLILYAPRRYGKTSLIKKVLAELERKRAKEKTKASGCVSRFAVIRKTKKIKRKRVNESISIW
jgi:AAA+ ATPase superfamily predicted ATPase